MDKIKRQKIWERDNSFFTYEERYAIGEKSGHKCCHCGKKVYPDYGATIDHFIPLSQGGKSIETNMIMLCDKCNTEKKDKIYDPVTYLKYLNEEDLGKLEGYFDSYIRSFDFFERRNVLACDRYTYGFSPSYTSRSYAGTHNKKVSIKNAVWKINIDRIDNNNFKEAEEFYIKYLKKRDLLDSEYAAKKNLEFWMRFGCLYAAYKNGEISVLCAITICTHIESEDMSDEEKRRFAKHSIKLAIMPYYDTETSFNIAAVMARQIPMSIMEEQELPYILVDAISFPNDRFAGIFSHHFGLAYVPVTPLNGSSMACYKLRRDEITDENRASIANFFEKYNRQISDVKEFLEDPENSDDLWMEWLIEDHEQGIV